MSDKDKSSAQQAIIAEQQKELEELRKQLAEQAAGVGELKY